MRARRPRRTGSLAVLCALVAVSPWLLPTAAPPPTAAPAQPAPTVAQAQPRSLRRAVPPPPIVPRADWRADTVAAPPPARYAPRVRAAVVHHTDTPNGYDCAAAPGIVRNLYAGHAQAKRWDDIGYNFLVDTCGTIYEGRAGGVDRPVVAAHARGFNEGTVGIAAIGTFGYGVPVPEPMLDAIARLIAWKLGADGPDARGTASLVSTNDESRYRKGTRAVLPVVFGHTDSYHTHCPGAALYAQLPALRERVARLQAG